QQEKKSEAKAKRNTVTAPQQGIVMNLRVIEPGAAILDLVPDRDKLVLEVKVQPTDIDEVKSGLPATVRFVAYKQRTTPAIQGKVVRISADAVTEERTGITYFLATIEVDSDQLSLVPQVKLYPGMPVEASIVTGSRTMLAFLLEPITDSFAHAFREE